MKRKVLALFALSLFVMGAASLPAVVPIVNSSARVSHLCYFSSQSEVTIPFELISRHIVLQVRVDNSRPLSFVFDTGDKVGIIDLNRAREMGLRLGREVRIGGAG